MCVIQTSSKAARCLLKSQIYLHRLKVKDEIYLYSLTGERVTRLAPDFVGAASIGGRRDKSHFFVTLTGFTTPGVVARYDFTEKEEEKRWNVYRTTIVSGLKPDDFVAEQVCAQGLS